MAKRAKVLYRIKGISGEFNASAALRTAAGALSMSIDNKDNKTIRKWIDEHVTDFKWSENWPAQINGALKKGARGDGPGKRGRRMRVERNILAERLAAAVHLLKQLDHSPKHKVLDAEVTAAEKGIDALANQSADSVEAFVAHFGGSEEAMAVVAKVAAYTPFTFPAADTPDHAVMKWVVRLAGEDQNLDKLKKAVNSVKPNPYVGLLSQFVKADHAKAALEAVSKMVAGEDPDSKSDDS